MKYFIFLSLCFASVLTDQDIKDYDLSQFVDLFENLAEYRPADVTNQDVTFFLYTRNISHYQLTPIGQFNTTQPTKLIIHGYLDNHNRSWYHHLTSEYLKKDDFNIIQVDWWRVARSFYFSSAHNTKLVGAYVARFLLRQNLPPMKLHLIGHSLGAHIAAYAARILRNATGLRIARITGLDPAGPAFRGSKNILNARDADVVDVFHTDGGFLGYYLPLGSFDIYLNGGVRIQPDCRINLTVSTPGELFEETYCSHTRSYVRFTELINNVTYSCRKCTSWVRYMMRLCDSNGKWVFGAEDITNKMTGVCFVTTH